jgi:hypothetical protein
MWKAFACLSFSVVLLAHFPPSRRIAFVREHTEGLYLLDYGSGRSHTLDVGMSNVQGLAYSAKAALLAFEGSKDEDEPPALYVFHLKDRRRELIHKASEDDILYRPAFDPDGNHVYAVNYSRGIFRYSLAKKTWDRVPVSGGGAVLNPQMLAFSKTGKKVAISPGHFQGFLIARVVGGGFVLEQHLLTDFRSCISPQWIGDQAIVFAGRREDGPQYLWRLDLGSGGVAQLTHPLCIPAISCRCRQTKRPWCSRVRIRKNLLHGGYGRSRSMAPDCDSSPEEGMRSTAIYGRSG